MEDLIYSCIMSVKYSIIKSIKLQAEVQIKRVADLVIQKENHPTFLCCRYICIHMTDTHLTSYLS